MDADRRRRLAIAAAELELPVLDDTTLADAVISGPPPMPMAAWGREVMTVGSVSKSFWGGLRVGWLRADESRVAAFASVKAGEDLGTSMLAQAATARLLPRIDEARAQRRAALGEGRALALSQLAQLLPEWHPVVPAGGVAVDPAAAAGGDRAGATRGAARRPGVAGPDVQLCRRSGELSPGSAPPVRPRS